MEHPPLNALPAACWFALAVQLKELGEDPAVRVVVLRAEGRGFSAGVDIKELQASSDFSALVAVNRGCAAAFAAVYECQVPRIAAVHGFCLGSGIGLAGNANILVASEDATCGLPEVDRARCATHLAGCAQHRMRDDATSATATTPSC
jgi:enoyl-CoA hydratase